MANIEYDTPAVYDERWYAERIAYMSEFILPERVGNFRRVLDMRTRYLTVCAENTFHSQNASALVRSCEAFGLQDIYTIETLCKFKPHVDIVRGTDKWVDLRRNTSAADAIAAMKGVGYRIIATTPHADDTTPESFDVAAGPFALVFGTEHAGISEEIMGAADGYIKIPMCGFVESLNVSASAAILLHILTDRIRSNPSIRWQLPDEEKSPLLLQWLMASIRDSRRILLRRFPE